MPPGAGKRLCRERDLGSLEGYTRKKILETFPEKAARRAKTGKFHHRPPGGESWTDVALRLRSVLGDIRAEYHDANVWTTYIVTPQGRAWSDDSGGAGRDWPPRTADVATWLASCSASSHRC